MTASSVNKDNHELLTSNTATAFPVKIVGVEKRDLHLMVTSNMTIRQVYRLIEKKWGWAAQDLILIFNNSRLNEEKSLGWVRDSCTLGRS